MKTFAARLLPVLAFLSFLVPAKVYAEPPPTVAETSDYKATSRHADVVDFCQKLAKESPLVRLGDLGTTSEGRKLPLVIVADPPVSTPDDARRGGKLVVFAMGNIHAGEVDGKEALLMLARDLATAKDRPLLKDLVLVFAPIFNADGNERFGKHRPYQNGPDEVGIRQNAQGFDLNRDFVKLESPEVRALVRCFNQWDPAVFVDCHTTNGSYHRYTITYEGGRVPAGDPKLNAYVRDEMLPDVTKRLEKASGYKSYFYGNFSPDRSRWETELPIPRFGTHYASLRGRVGILCESYVYAPFKDRVLASRDFVRSVFEFAADNKAKLGTLLKEARDPAKADAKVALRYRPAPVGRPHALLGFVEELKDGRRVKTDQPKEYEVQYFGDTETTLAVSRPYGYLFPASLSNAVQLLQRHGIQVEELREDIELNVEAYTVEKVTKAGAFQKHPLVTVEVAPRKETRRIEAGTILVRMNQPQGRLAAYLLEPQALDGLTTWNAFDAVLQEGKDFPVLRLPAATPITSGAVRPLAEDRASGKRITIDMFLGSGRPPNFNGSPISITAWLPDGEHFLQQKEGKLYKVHALTGRCQPFYDPARLAEALAKLPGLDAKAAVGLARGFFLHMNPQKTGSLFVHDSDLYYCTLDGTRALRLTKSPGFKEEVSFSPDGEQVAFVRQNNLFVVDLATQTERALTSDGSDVIFNGRADWVYYEEIFDRARRAYWWSPDSKQIAFIRYDDRPVKKFTVLDMIPAYQVVEQTPYPKAGSPNPLVKVGIVSATGGDVRWADLNGYPETSILVSRAGWTPDSGRVYFFVMDRNQTWLDVCTVSPQGGSPTKLFRDSTKAWVDEPGPLTFLKDGSFLFNSARTGWNHIYLYGPDGKLRNPVTSGEWEVTSGAFEKQAPEAVDEEGGWVYFRGKRDCPIASNLYRARLDGSAVERLTDAPGDHRPTVGPGGKLFVDTWSSHTTPSKVALRKGDGALARMLDTNPVYVREEYRTGKYEMVKIKAPDGYEIDASILRPVEFDPAKRYPVWVEVYGGPHLPTMRDSWAGGRTFDEALANQGYIIFHCDPRSASGKGSVYTWACYRQLGVQELMDIECAVRWLTDNHSWADATRVGISGGSYGGYMTAFALTHSKLFAAGVSSFPVTDWHNYDSIYTERYMLTPKENPDGYEKTSVVKAAANLHGKLLLLHGLMDDNVHVQNTVQLMNALQNANKDFEVMFYAHARHGIGSLHYRRLSVEFMQRALKPGT